MPATPTEVEDSRKLLQLFFLMERFFHCARVVHLALDVGKAGVKSRGVGCITKLGGPLAWLPPLMRLPNQRRRFCDFLGLQN